MKNRGHTETITSSSGGCARARGHRPTGHWPPVAGDGVRWSRWGSGFTRLPLLKHLLSSPSDTWTMLLFSMCEIINQMANLCTCNWLSAVRWSTLHGSSLPLPVSCRGCGGVSQHIQTSSTHPMASRLIVHLLTLNLQLSDAQTFKSWRESKDNKDGRCR